MAIIARLLAQKPDDKRKLYALHAPEVECIGKGKAHPPYEFGAKVSVATPIKHSKGGQFVTHVAALPGNPLRRPHPGQGHPGGGDPHRQYR